MHWITLIKYTMLQMNSVWLNFYLKKEVISCIPTISWTEKLVERGSIDRVSRGIEAEGTPPKFTRASRSLLFTLAPASAENFPSRRVITNFCLRLFVAILVAEVSRRATPLSRKLSSKRRKKFIA